MKVIFLDFDGVLNSKKHYTKDEQGVLGLSPFHVGILNQIIETTGAYIVLSTSWRLDFSVGDPYEYCIKELKKNGFKYENNIIGMTKDLSLKGKKRGDEIALWIDENHPEKYLIIDDVDDFLEEQKEYLILTNQKKGLTEKEKKKAIKILGEK